MRKQKMNEINYISKHWAIAPDVLQDLCNNLKDMKLKASFLSERPMSNTRNVRIKNGVAIIPIHGVITAREDIFTFLCGGTALDGLIRDFHRVLDDSEVKAILFDIDSPGGVAIGTSEIAEAIYNARTKKPIYSYVGRNCCSAAYWLASATEKIIAHKSALVGSIGVVSSIPIQEKADKDGFKHIEVLSSNAKNKRPDPRTPEGLTEIKKELDAIENEFITSLAKYRGLSESKIMEDFGQGGVVLGGQALALGMVDELSNFENSIKSLSALTINHNKGENKMPENTNLIDKNLITADFLRRERPELVKIFSEEGANAEHERLLAIDKASLNGYEDLAQKAKENPQMTAEKLALQIIEAEKTKGNDYLASLKTAEKNMPKISHSANTGGNVHQIDENAPVSERAEAKWNSDSKIRTEFGGDKEAFVAYYTASDNGQVKLQNNKGA